MSIYVDTSVLVSMFAEDVNSDRTEELLADPGQILVVTDLALAEFASSIASLVRMRELSRDGAAAALAALDDCGFDRGLIGPVDIAQATAWIRALDINLRAPDAIHLAAAQRLGLPIATFDRGMARAAESLGLPLTPV